MDERHAMAGRQPIQGDLAACEPKLFPHQILPLGLQEPPLLQRLQRPGMDRLEILPFVGHMKCSFSDVVEFRLKVYRPPFPQVSLLDSLTSHQGKFHTPEMKIKKRTDCFSKAANPFFASGLLPADYMCFPLGIMCFSLFEP